MTDKRTRERLADAIEAGAVAMRCPICVESYGLGSPGEHAIKPDAACSYCGGMGTVIVSVEATEPVAPDFEEQSLFA